MAVGVVNVMIGWSSGSADVMAPTWEEVYSHVAGAKARSLGLPRS